MGTERRAQMLRRSGLSQAAIAQRLGVTRYRVRLAWPDPLPPYRNPSHVA
jgi:transcriptional regulator with XRE-family HTH domain